MVVWSVAVPVSAERLSRNPSMVNLSIAEDILLCLPASTRWLAWGTVACGGVTVLACINPLVGLGHDCLWHVLACINPLVGLGHDCLWL